MVDRRQEMAPEAVQRMVRRPAAPVAARPASTPALDPQADDKPAVDMSTLQASIGYHMRRAQLAIFSDIIKAFAADDIRPAHYSVMVLIAANPGLNQSEIAAALGIKRTNFVALIDSLETRGLAQRAATLSDRRSYALFLTAAGETLLERLNALQREHEARVVARVGADNRDVLLQLLGQIVTLAGDDVIED